MLYSVELNRTFRGLGFDNHKSESMTGQVLDEIDLEFHGAFFRGYFDGDGHIANLHGNEFRITIAGTFEFLERLNESISDLAKVSPGYIYRSGNVFLLSFTGAERLRSIREWSRTEGYWLERKKVVWEKVNPKGTSSHPYIYLMKDGRWWARWRDSETKRYFHFGRYATESEAYEAQQEGLRGL